MSLNRNKLVDSLSFNKEILSGVQVDGGRLRYAHAIPPPLQTAPRACREGLDEA